VSKALATAFDALNAAIEEAETNLVLLALGTSAEVPLAPESTEALGFGRIGDRWGLYLERRGEVRPLLEGSRELRCAAAERLTDLLDALLAASEANIREVTEATGKTRAFAARVLELVPPAEPKGAGP
jgi:hypothetical protein